MKFLWVWLALSALGFCATVSVEKRFQPQAMTFSVVIPCSGVHFQHLEPLLQEYAHQTRLPDDVVVALSLVETLRKEEISALESYPWPFRFLLLKHEGKRSAGMNRNVACTRATGDVILCQDADDLPHPQRVEIVKYLFENYEIEHLMHEWVGPGQDFPLYAPEEILPERFKKYDDITWEVHNGNVSLLRSLTRNTHWDDVFFCDHDTHFNRWIYRRCKNTAVIHSKLVMYRRYLSSFLCD